ncbi:MAG TPA: metallophosphoesterase [Longimicrobiales bacterium]|nr:metallophosphoesterase [Longimicrobiales bacterium]
MADGEREIRIAAVGDLHYDVQRGTSFRDMFSAINRKADILVICGDMTTHGKPDQMRAFVDELAGVDIPIVAVLGNHDYEAGMAEEVTDILKERGVSVLDGDHVIIDGVGFAGTKGFAGGFGRGALAPFGELLIKEFVQSALDEALKLENGLRSIHADVKVAVLHYAPIHETIIGEPEVIWPFLGSSRLLGPIETLEADLVFHGHAHHGTFEAKTPAGIPVYNVAMPILQERGQDFYIHTVKTTDRRKQAERLRVVNGPA